MSKPYRPGAGIGLSGVDQNTAHSFGGAGEIFLRHKYGRGPEQVGGEHAGGHGGPFTDHKCQIVTGFALVAKIRRGGGQSETQGKRHIYLEKSCARAERRRHSPAGKAPHTRASAPFPATLARPAQETPRAAKKATSVGSGKVRAFAPTLRATRQSARCITSSFTLLPAAGHSAFSAYHYEK